MKKSFSYNINGNDYEVKVLNSSASTIELEVNGTPYSVALPSTPASKAEPTPSTPPPQATQATPAPAAKPASGGSPVIAPLPGVIVKLLVKQGDTVAKGDRVAVLEAMKMENDLKAEASGTILSVNVTEGESVPEGTTVLTIG